MTTEFGMILASAYALLSFLEIEPAKKVTNTFDIPLKLAIAIT